jgi:hypothetical protein
MHALSGWRIAATSVLLAALAAWIFTQWLPGGAGLPSAAEVAAPVSGSDDFDEATHATRNDMLVLRAALSGFCDGASGTSLLSAEPIDSFDWRTSLHPLHQPLPDCPGIEIIRSGQIDAAVARAGPDLTAPAAPGVTAFWAELQRDFPRAEIWVSASMPIYGKSGGTATVVLQKGGPCAHCASGWEYDLALHEGRWVVVETRNTMIS